jgi:hypothetical protein
MHATTEQRHLAFTATSTNTRYISSEWMFDQLCDPNTGVYSRLTWCLVSALLIAFTHSSHSRSCTQCPHSCLHPCTLLTVACPLGGTGMCGPTVPGTSTVAYFDSHHLSTAGALYLAPLLNCKLRDLGII